MVVVVLLVVLWLRIKICWICWMGRIGVILTRVHITMSTLVGWVFVP